MPADSAGTRQEPEVLVDTAGLSEAEWLAWRRKGIGGSDAAAILGISPWRTARDLYDDKLGIASAQDDSGNWVALEMGHLLEDLVARIFSQKTGYPIFQIKKMFRSPRHPCMLADVDYFVTLPDGSTAILEIKTTNYNARSHWWDGDAPIVPPYYESQGRHYMAVMDLDRVFFCCLYGNNEDEVEIRDLHRDLAYEQEMIFLEESFWENHIQAHVPPPYTEDGELVLASLQRRFGAGNETLPQQQLGSAETAVLNKYLQYQEQKKALTMRVKEIDRVMKRLQGRIVAGMGACWTAGCQDAEMQYLVSNPAVRRPMIGKDALERLHRDHPEIYREYVTVSESRRFSVKQTPLSTAQDAAAYPPAGQCPWRVQRDNTCPGRGWQKPAHRHVSRRWRPGGLWREPANSRCPSRRWSGRLCARSGCRWHLRFWSIDSRSQAVCVLAAYCVRLTKVKGWRGHVGIPPV